ncbi:tetratricopeptide repeat protein [Lusitaniella coriacea]|uniref:tetratricopeptide repeat protein n=1 Tax=Lusitaniella coriacea TaxID=1983105 RepID=UPI003CEBD6A3
MGTKSIESVSHDEIDKAYDDLIVTIEAKGRSLSLLVAVCDDLPYRESIIADYERELQPSFRSYRVTLDPNEPSLRAAIAELVQREPYLQEGGKAVITATGIERLYGVKLGEARSQQEIFFGYLQWTREAFREFPYAIVVWVTNPILSNLVRKAPDFWSWREGVFRFVSHKSIVVPRQDWEPIRQVLQDREWCGWDEHTEDLPIEDVKALIAQAQQQPDTNKTTLATLYFSLGKIYYNRLERGKSSDYQAEQRQGIEYLQQAAALQEELGLGEELATTLSYLAELYRSQGRYEAAEPLYLEALDLKKKLLGEEHPHVASSLNNLAGLYKSQGRYEAAEPLYLEALDLYKKLLGEEHPDVATSLNNLATLYESQGRYEAAEPLYLEALEMRKKLLGEEHPHVATSLNNLAFLYESQGRYEAAEPLYLDALDLRKKLLGEEHPHTQTVRGNFRYLIQQAVQNGKVGELSAHPVTQEVLQEILAN